MFGYQLAEQLGQPSVSRMLGRMTSREVAEWRAFYRMREREVNEPSVHDVLAETAEAKLQAAVARRQSDRARRRNR